MIMEVKRGLGRERIGRWKEMLNWIRCKAPLNGKWMVRLGSGELLPGWNEVDVWKDWEEEARRIGWKHDCRLRSILPPANPFVMEVDDAGRSNDLVRSLSDWLRTTVPDSLEREEADHQEGEC